MNGRMLAPALVVMVALAAVPLPFSEEAEVALGPGEILTYRFDIPSPARVTFIIGSDEPVEVTLVDLSPASDGTPRSEVMPGSAEQVTTVHWTEQMSPGSYQLVLRNGSPNETEVYYQVHFDYKVVGELTAKNLMALSLAVAVAIVAAFLYWPRRHFQ